MTQLNDKMKQAGFDRLNNEVRLVYSKWLNAGRTRVQFNAVLDAADLGKAQIIEPERDGISPKVSEAGRTLHAHQHAQPDSARSSGRKGARPSARVPSKSQHAAMGRSLKKSAKSLITQFGWIGTAVIPNGPQLIAVRACDIPGMIERELKESGERAQFAVVLRIVKQKLEERGVPADATRPWSESFTPAEISALSAMTHPDTLKTMAAGWLRGFSQAAITSVGVGVNA